ncbi:Glucose-repressible alcohol dehydrogenase transcriptional effector [Lithohypha guttulata]|uniref:Glucose-repressible alcohol dehydrogenase transcriptional effector n=1 Tax=Lithohypha guttulata TaxID=1690604 RepID=UPI002DE098E2|nr:Glucose-repressible alcohol dehydrogenase transcriptional effector [Lithohypha guttulata]KAK5106144.1 Glucose-repressible alcohol dehydrogenase transcriptional effector [Lithohypha guttulata]
MADGPYRFHQPGGGPFYPAHHTSRNHNRATSPPGRRPFAHDTPSPSRSPGNAAMVHNFGVYNQNGFQQQHMMNGGQNHQRFNGLHIPKQQQAYHQSQHHNAQQQIGHIGHQHNVSGGTYQSATPNLHTYGQDHLQNGNRDDGPEDEYNGNEHWQEQQRLYDECREMCDGHHRARTYAQQSKSSTFGGPLGAAADDATVEDKVRAATAQSQTRQAWTELDLGGQGLRALSSNLYQYSFLTRLDIPHNALRELPAALGQLKTLEYLDVSFNNLVSLPDEIGMLTNLKTLLLCGNNHLAGLPYSLGYLYKLETIAVMDIILTEDAKQALLNGGTKALINYLLETMPDDYVEPPSEREWHQLDEVIDTDADTFKTVTYNILCERYASKQKYGYVAERSLNWHTRRQLVLDELAGLDADVVCLQELDRNSYDEFFRKELSNLGYKAYYAQKSRAETIGENAKFVDGCGTFWKDKNYVLLDTQHLVLGRRAVDRPGAKASADMLNRVWQRDDIATVVFLENRFTGSRLIVANSHVYWDPAFKDVKLIQVAVLMEELNKLAEKYAKYPPANNKKPSWQDDDDDQREPAPSLEYSSGSQIPTVVCGDFNSGPGSPVYDLFTKRILDANHNDFKGRSYGSFSTDGMSHIFTLKSTNSLMEQPFITNYTPDFVDELDHIFYSSNSLRPIGALGAVDPEYLKRVPGFPNQHFPSDHLALMAEFKVEKQRNPQKVEADFGPSSRRN